MINTWLRHCLLLPALLVSTQSFADNCGIVNNEVSLSDSQEYTLELKTVCGSPYSRDIRIFNKENSHDLGRFLFPYSYTISVNTVKSPNKPTYLFTANPSESEPQGSYYFVLFNTSGTVLLSGYSDREVYADNLDNDIFDEIIVGVNTENADPLEHLLDYIPYPVVYDWNKNGKLKLQPSSQYKPLFEKYLSDQEEYEKALEVKMNEQKR